MPYTFGACLSTGTDGFDTVFDTITSAGSRKKYMDFILSVRASGRVEPRLAMAASSRKRACKALWVTSFLG